MEIHPKTNIPYFPKMIFLIRSTNSLGQRGSLRSAKKDHSIILSFYTPHLFPLNSTNRSKWINTYKRRPKSQKNTIDQTNSLGQRGSLRTFIPRKQPTYLFPLSSTQIAQNGIIHPKDIQILPK